MVMVNSFFALHAFFFRFWRENRQKAGWLSWPHFLNDSNYSTFILASHIMPLAMGTPVLQSMTAADPNLDVGDWLQSIPVGIRRRVLPFCDIPLLVLFVAIPTSYRRFSFEECPILWKTIDFGRVNQR
jgi:hypothetical protein